MISWTRYRSYLLPKNILILNFQIKRLFLKFIPGCSKFFFIFNKMSFENKLDFILANIKRIDYSVLTEIKSYESDSKYDVLIKQIFMSYLKNNFESNFQHIIEKVSLITGLNCKEFDYKLNSGANNLGSIIDYEGNVFTKLIIKTNPSVILNKEILFYEILLKNPSDELNSLVVEYYGSYNKSQNLINAIVMKNLGSTKTIDNIDTIGNIVKLINRSNIYKELSPKSIISHRGNHSRLLASKLFRLSLDNLICNFEKENRLENYLSNLNELYLSLNNPNELFRLNHNDLNGSNILSSSDKIYVLDWGSYSVGIADYDYMKYLLKSNYSDIIISKMITHLSYQKNRIIVHIQLIYFFCLMLKNKSIESSVLRNEYLVLKNYIMEVENKNVRKNQSSC